MSKIPDPEVPTSASRSPSNPVGGMLVPSGGMLVPNSADAGSAQSAIDVDTTMLTKSFDMFPHLEYVGGIGVLSQILVSSFTVVWALLPPAEGRSGVCFIVLACGGGDGGPPA
jgi:hypothetical protein